MMKRGKSDLATTDSTYVDRLRKTFGESWFAHGDAMQLLVASPGERSSVSGVLQRCAREGLLESQATGYEVEYRCPAPPRKFSTPARKKEVPVKKKSAAKAKKRPTARRKTR